MNTGIKKQEPAALDETSRPTAQQVFDRIHRCQGDEGMAKMWRSWNVLTLIIDYGGLKGLTAGPEAMQVYTMMEARFGVERRAS